MNHEEPAERVTDRGVTSARAAVDPHVPLRLLLRRVLPPEPLDALTVADPLVAAKDRYAWLRSYSPWAVFDPEGAEDRVSTCADSFEKSIDDVIMYEFPDMIAEPLSLSDLSGRLGGGRVTNIHVVWPEKGRPRLRVTNERGEETELKMI